MMEIEIPQTGAFGSALIRLQPGEQFVSESGAMYRASSNVDVDVTTHSRSGGGLLKGLKRLLASEHFFFSRYSMTDTLPGEVGLAPVLQGEVRVVEATDECAWICTGGSFLGAEPSLDIDTRFQGFRGLFSGESLSFLRVAGRGRLLVNAFGRISEFEATDGLIVDTGHVVAFQESLDYRIGKAGTSWLHSFLGGEGLVLDFSGQGKVLVQSHNPKEFGSRLGRLLPPRD